MAEHVLTLAYLTAAVAPASLVDALDGLRRSGAIQDYRISGDRVHLSGDFVALELSALELDREVSPRLGDDMERGFHVSSDVNGRRGAPTAKAADVEGTRAYYGRATELLRDGSLSPPARRIWELHVDGLSEEKIAARLGMARRKVVKQLMILRYRAGITKELRGWAIRCDS